MSSSEAKRTLWPLLVRLTALGVMTALWLPVLMHLVQPYAAVGDPPQVLTLAAFIVTACLIPVVMFTLPRGAADSAGTGFLFVVWFLGCVVFGGLYAASLAGFGEFDQDEYDACMAESREAAERWGLSPDYSDVSSNCSM